MNLYHYLYHGQDIGIKEYLHHLGFSATFIKRVKYGGVKQNGQEIHMRAMIKDGDTIDITDVDLQNENIRPRLDIPVKILYENEDFLAVHKPSSMPTHPSRGNHLPTLAEAVIGHFSPQPFVFRPINRLDKDTSGIVLIAKNANAAYHLSQAMKNGWIKKEYDAIVLGIPIPQTGTVSAPIKRESENSMKRCVSPDGKIAVTDYEVTKIREDKNAVVHLRLHTGRTHQIRVHMAYIGHPLLADALYGEAVEGQTFSLSATKMTISFPDNNTMIEITDPSSFDA